MDTSQSFRPLDSASPHTIRRRKRNKTGREKLRKSDPLWVGTVEKETLYNVSGDNAVWMTNPHTPTPLTMSTPSHLTPDWFQQPVKLLNSIEQALNNPSEYPEMPGSQTTSHMTVPASHTATSVNHMTGVDGNMTSLSNFVASKPPPPKRRRSSTSNGPPLDDLGECFNCICDNFNN